MSISVLLHIMELRALLKYNELSGGILICHVDVIMEVQTVNTAVIDLAAESNSLMQIKLS